MSPLRWTVKSTRTLAAELARVGHRISADTVGDLLREEGFSLSDQRGHQEERNRRRLQKQRPPVASRR